MSAREDRGPRGRERQIPRFGAPTAEPESFNGDERWGRRRADLDFEDVHGVASSHKRSLDQSSSDAPDEKRPRMDGNGPPIPPAEKEKPNFVPSGHLKGDVDTATFKGKELKWAEPRDSAMPTRRWRLYVFKGTSNIETVELHKMSCYMFGRDREIADVPIDHPSCSKQHAVIQYRAVADDDESGARVRVVKPYLMDLGSANGTFLNDDKLKPQVYVELRERDVVKFGLSTRTYVLLHDQSASADDDGPAEQ